MIGFVGILTVAAGVWGFMEAGVFGALTGLITSIGTGSGIAIFVGAKGTDLAFPRHHDRLKQRIGGLIGAAACLLGAVYLGWRWGWLAAILGYALGAFVTWLWATLTRRQTAVGADLDQRTSNDPLPILTPHEFIVQTSGGRPNAMNMSIYEGHLFACACGTSHSYHEGEIDVIRELPGMRLVMVCPDTDSLTCVKVQGIVKFQGFRSLFGTRGTDSSDDAP